MEERLKTALRRTAKFIVIIIGAIACIACAIGLYFEQLPEPNVFLRYVEIIVLSLNAIVLIKFDIDYVNEVRRGVYHGR